MKRLVHRAAVLAAALAVAGCSRRGSTGTPEPVASGTLRNAAGERVGVATIRDTAGIAELGISVSGLAPGPHGLHFHAQGTCTAPEFTSAGPHLDPGGRKHGRLNPDGPHRGDLPNLIVGAEGSADTSFALARELASGGPGALLQPGGTSLVIHADPDDERTDPSGNSGARVACAVLEPG
ncbi:MAG TPA: superoxide dismutase family protein [Gemmatimonadales bacterium]|nr:superoxide dismutase family protein [Gemmatimonadales bacterium]